MGSMFSGWSNDQWPKRELSPRELCTVAQVLVIAIPIAYIIFLIALEYYF